MRNDQLKRISATLRLLSASERKRIAAELASLDAELTSTRIVEGRFAADSRCPHRQSGKSFTTGMPTVSLQVLPTHLPPDTVLCSDGSSALAAAARALGVEHHAVNVSAGARVVGPWHIQNVNAYHSRLKAWIKRFQGVATCYLHNDLGWFRAIDRARTNRLNPEQWLALAVGLRV